MSLGAMRVPPEYGKIYTSFATFIVSRQTLNEFRLVYTECKHKTEVVSFRDLYGDSVTTMIEDIMGMCSVSRDSLIQEHQMSNDFDAIAKEHRIKDWTE